MLRTVNSNKTEEDYPLGFYENERVYIFLSKIEGRYCARRMNKIDLSGRVIYNSSTAKEAFDGVLNSNYSRDQFTYLGTSITLEMDVEKDD